MLVAIGSTYRRLEIPGEDGLIGAGVHFCATCDGLFYRDAEELLVVGGGNSALEEGLFLAQFAKRIRVVARNGLTASKPLIEKVSHHPRFTVHTVRTDDTFATSMPGVFCAGDVRARSTKQLGAAVGDGIAALIAIRSFLQRHATCERSTSTPESYPRRAWTYRVPAIRS